MKLMVETFRHLFVDAIMTKLLSEGRDTITVATFGIHLANHLRTDLEFTSDQYPMSFMFLWQNRWSLITTKDFSVDTATYIEERIGCGNDSVYQPPVSVIIVHNLICELMEKHNLMQDDVWKEIENA